MKKASVQTNPPLFILLLLDIFRITNTTNSLDLNSGTETAELTRNIDGDRKNG